MISAARSIILSVLMVLGLPGGGLRAGTSAAGQKAEVKLRQVALFKNGVGFFVMEAAVPEKAETFVIVPPGAASHGTFWVSYSPKLKLDSLAAREVESSENVEAVTIAELLRANVGQRVRLHIGGQEKQLLEGVITHFPADRERGKADAYSLIEAPYMTGGSGYKGPGEVNRAQQSCLMLLERSDGQVAIDPQSVVSVEFRGDRVERTFAKKGKSMQLEARLGARSGGEKLTISYLAKGVTWAPSYVVDISGKGKAKLSAKAAIINEVCDMDGVGVQLVTGVPHLKFADVSSPLALKQNLAWFLQSVALAERGRGREQGVMYQTVGGSGGYGGYGGGGYYGSAEPPIMPEYEGAKEGKTAEDLFLYPVDDVRLDKGETGYYPLFTESVAYKHIYQWDIPDYMNELERYYYRAQHKDKPEPQQDVWHCLRMENTTSVPWTTAPAETVKEGLILGQDILKYTPKKGRATLRITRAASVKAEQSELEVARKREALHLYGDYFDLITVEGELSATNFQDKAITLEVSKTLSGEVQSSQQAKIEKQAKGLRRMNGVARLTWTIELNAGERKQIVYKYEVYVRR